MNPLLKTLLLVAPLLFTACVSIKVPHLVEDTANVSKSAYNAVSEKIERRKRERDGKIITHSYIGSGNQTVNEVKQRCEAEAANKLRQMGGGEVRYSVLDNDIVTINGAIAANCRLAMGR
jgi:hypothetical protein